MGFPESDARAALEQCAGSNNIVQAAMEHLFSLTAEGATGMQTDAEATQAEITGTRLDPLRRNPLLGVSMHRAIVDRLGCPRRCKLISLLFTGSIEGNEDEGQAYAEAEALQHQGPSAVPEGAAQVARLSSTPGSSSKVSKLLHIFACSSHHGLHRTLMTRCLCLGWANCADSTHLLLQCLSAPRFSPGLLWHSEVCSSNFDPSS